MNRYLLYLLLLSAVFSCKKKDQEATPATTTNAPQTADYQSNLRTNLILTKNGSNFDTSFAFVGKYVKIVGSSQTWSPFSSTNYNGYLSDGNNNFNGEILSCPNFIQLASKSTWNVTSTEFGNFQYSDSVNPVFISTTLTQIPTTYTASQGIPIKIAGFPVGYSIYLGDKSSLYFPWTVANYNGMSFPSTLDTIRDTLKAPEFFSVPINTTFTLSISLSPSFNSLAYLNGHESFLFKPTIYYYPIKRIN
ncbi:MAG: hypothetical protein IPL10_15790 [Bacteroidetes bacterium]|jgi:hypothetical protein|nr:hypothetical protein [Bacteroidota bacterium]